MTPTVGICEDDDELRSVLRDALRREGYDVRVTRDGQEALRAFSIQAPDLLVLDVGLPDSNGRDLCQALRACGVTAPVLFLSARDGVHDRVSGFRAGGDDYVIKPFALSELVVRVEALLRRAPAASDEPRAPLLDPTTHSVGDVAVTPTEFRLLALLVAHRGEVVRRAALVRAGWPDGAIVHDNTLDKYLAALRRKLREAAVGAHLETVRGVGYRLS